MHKEYQQKQRFEANIEDHAQSRKSTVNPYSSDDLILELDQIQAPKPLTTNPHFITVFKTNSIQRNDREASSEDLKQQKSSHTTHISSLDQNSINNSEHNSLDESDEEIEHNTIAENSIRHIPFLPLPTYPPEVYVNSEVIEFDFRPIGNFPLTTSRPVTGTASASLQKNSALVIKSTLELASEHSSNETKQRSIENNLDDKNFSETAFKPTKSDYAIQKRQFPSKVKALSIKIISP